jgi:hypothetical protein
MRLSAPGFARDCSRILFPPLSSRVREGSARICECGDSAPIGEDLFHRGDLHHRNAVGMASCDSSETLHSASSALSRVPFAIWDQHRRTGDK